LSECNLNLQWTIDNHEQILMGIKHVSCRADFTRVRGESCVQAIMTLPPSFLAPCSRMSRCHVKRLTFWSLYLNLVLLYPNFPFKLLRTEPMAFMDIERRWALGDDAAPSETLEDEDEDVDAGAAVSRALADDGALIELLLLEDFRAAAMMERLVASDKGGIVSMHKNTTLIFSSCISLWH